MEELTFKITLDATWHGAEEDAPVCNIQLNEGTKHTYQIYNNKPYVVEFTKNASKSNILKIELLNKKQSDVVLDENGKILKDKLLHIRDIEIDDINMYNLAHMHSVYTPTDPWFLENYEVRPLKHHMDLGWNGEWKLNFNTPFYIWLLETL